VSEVIGYNVTEPEQRLSGGKRDSNAVDACTWSK